MTQITGSKPERQHPDREGRRNPGTRPKKANHDGNRRKDHTAPRAICTEVQQLPDHLHKVVDRMLTEGATFEDTVDAVGELGQEQIALSAVEIYFRSNPPLQQDRARRQVETAQNLKSALKNPDSAQAEFAEAVLLTGLMGLRRGSAVSNMQHAVRAKEQQENYRLKEEAFRLKSEKFVLDLKMVKARLNAERAKLSLATNRLEQLKRAMERERGGSTLSPEMIQRIQEVYGIVSDDSSSTPDS